MAAMLARMFNMDDKILNDLDESIILNFYRAAVRTKNINLLKEILERNPNLIHPDYRNFDVLTVDNIVQIFIEKGRIIQDMFTCPFNDINSFYRSHDNETESKLLEHLFAIRFNCHLQYMCFLTAAMTCDLQEAKKMLVSIARLRGRDNHDAFPQTNTSVSYDLPEEEMIRKLFERPEIISGCLVDFVTDDDRMLIEPDNVMEIVKILVETARADVNYVKPEGINKGSTPLLSAIKSKITDVALYLIENGAHVNIVNTNSKYQPLHLAIKHYQGISLVEKIIEQGADLNAHNQFNGFTALHHACSRGMQNCIELLIRKGADITKKDSAGRTPFSILISRDRDEFPIHILFLREIARAKFEGREVDEGDLEIIHTHHSFLVGYFRICGENLGTMKSSIFHPPYSYYDVLNMRNDEKLIRKLANLLRNDDFVRNFEDNFVLENVSLYLHDLKITYEEAEVIRDKYVKLESILESAIGKYIPITLVKYIVDFIGIQDLSTITTDGKSEDESSVI